MATAILRPNADGDLYQGLPSPLPNWYTRINEEVADEDASYIYFIANNQGFLAHLESLPGGIAAITNVAVYVRSRRWTAQSSSVSCRLKTGGSIYAGSTNYYSNQNYVTRGYSWAINPKTGVAWTVADVNALQAGGQFWPGSTTINCTQCYVVVTYDPVIAPTGTTDPATGIGAAAADLNGTLDDDGGEACDCGFEYGETVAYGNTTPTQSRTTGQTFAQTISGLDPGQTYHFRAFATNAAGTSYGADRSFTTIALSTLTTDPATGIGTAAATPNGTLDDDGGEACDCGFEYGETVAYGNTTPTQSRTTGQTFAQTISGLDPGQTYHFRAFATNDAGTSYGADRTFTTLVAASTVTTDPASALAAIAATLNGTLDDDGGEACDCGFEWGLDTGYGTITATESKTIGESFSQVIGGLYPGQTYHFRAFATNSVGTSYGADRSFASSQVISRAYALARREL